MMKGNMNPQWENDTKSNIHLRKKVTREQLQLQEEEEENKRVKWTNKNKNKPKQKIQTAQEKNL